MDNKLAKLLYIIGDILIYIAILSCITICWQRFEIIIEGSKHTSEVDSIIAMILAYFITDKYMED